MERKDLFKVKGLEAFKRVRSIKSDPIGFYTSMLKNYGDLIGSSFLGLNFIIVNDPIIIRYILQENSFNYHKSIFYKELALLVGKGLLTSEGAEWKKNRRLAQPAFKKSMVEGFTKIFAEEAEVLEKEWQTFRAKPIDISKSMMKVTFNIVGRTLFGTRLEEESKIVDENLSLALELIMDRIQSIFRFPLWVPTPKNLKLKKALNAMDKVVFKIINTRKESQERVNDLLDTLLYSRDEETGEGLSIQQIRDEVITFLLAGHETTANALTWTFYLLSEHPEIYQKVLKEIRENVPKNGGIDISHISKLELTEKVLKESLRLYPPAWVIERKLVNNDTIGGYPALVGDMVSISIYHLHRNPKYWSDPEVFNPERFTKEEEDKRHNFAYLPFGGGPRVCIGNNFAFTEAMIILATLLRSFEPKLEPNFKVEKEPLITLRPKNGMRMIL
ncbi:MAG: cytochrome P450 [Leptospiraceae bacterium]|nr:cytochrome P450 [Leptospiraceae bacterium]